MSVPSGTSNLAFLDGYLVRIMVDMLKLEGPDAGLFGYYVGRIEGGCAFSHPDRILLSKFRLAHFDRQKRCVVHAGIGLGTLTAALAVAGYTVAGVEWEGARRQAADRVRDSLIQEWPPVAENYKLMGGRISNGDCRYTLDVARDSAVVHQLRSGLDGGTYGPNHRIQSGRRRLDPGCTVVWKAERFTS